MPENNNISDVVRAGGGPSTAACPVGVKELAARLVDPLVGVRAEKVTLRLQQIRRQTLRAVAIVERERCRERRRRNAVLNRLDDCASPRGLVIIQRAAEELVDQ